MVKIETAALSFRKAIESSLDRCTNSLIHQCVVDILISNWVKIKKNSTCLSYTTVSSNVVFFCLPAFRGNSYAKRCSCIHNVTMLVFLGAFDHCVSPVSNYAQLTKSSSVKRPLDRYKSRLSVVLVFFKKVFFFYCCYWFNILSRCAL